jgi:hypothetical protein
MLRGWDWGDRYEVFGVVSGLSLFLVLLVLGVTPWWLPVLGIAVTVTTYAWRQRPWLG